MCECKDCKLNEGDCGHHFSMNDVIDYTIPSQTACDQFDYCMFFKPKKYEIMTNKEAIKRIQDHMHIHKMIEPRAIYITQALELAIKALENERPQGKWEFFSIGNNQYSRCSVCKDEHASEYTDLDWWYDNFKYCPKCGAHMLKEVKNDKS